jgi:hypothetical protein
MANGISSGVGNATPAASGAPTPGTRVWLLREGGFGRIVAVGQGGLVCRVRLERQDLVVDQLGCELLPLEDAGAA